MSGVYIKGGRSPISCYSCWHSYEGKCGLLGMDKELPWKGKRKDCPLIELPDHGDLIDRDEVVKRMTELFRRLYKKYGEYDDYVLGFSAALLFIDEYKAAIPAERSEDAET